MFQTCRAEPDQLSTFSKQDTLNLSFYFTLNNFIKDPDILHDEFNMSAFNLKEIIIFIWSSSDKVNLFCLIISIYFELKSDGFDIDPKVLLANDIKLAIEEHNRMIWMPVFNPKDQCSFNSRNFVYPFLN